MKSNKLQYSINDILLLTFVLLVLTAVAGCGGSGGGSDEVTTQPETTTNNDSGTSAEEEEDAADYTPDESKLDADAESSSDLYVEPEFQFDTYKTLTVDLLISNIEGAPMANTMVFISAVPADVTELDAPELADKSLLTVAKTDSSGVIYRQLEVSQTLSKVLIEVSAIGVENERLIDVPANNLINVQF